MPVPGRSGSYWVERGRQLVADDHDAWRLRDTVALLSMADVAPFVPAMGLPEIRTCQILELAEEFASDMDGVLDRTTEDGVMSGGRYAAGRLMVQVAARCGDPFSEALLSWIVTTFPRDHAERLRPFVWVMVIRRIVSDEETLARRLGIRREHARRLADVVESNRRDSIELDAATEAAFRNRTRSGWQQQVYSRFEEWESSPFHLVHTGVRHAQFLRFWAVVEEVLDEKGQRALLEWARTEARRQGMDAKVVTPVPKSRTH
jgi:hypothetical protein